MKKSLSLLSVVSVFVVSITGCMTGQGSSSNGSDQQNELVVYGRINATQPLRVLDYEFDSSKNTSAQEQDDDLPVGVGTVVQVKASLDQEKQSYSADEVEPQYALLGIIDEFAEDRTSLIVSGQEVLINDQTVFGNIDRDYLEAGNVVLVSGFYNSSSGITASRIDLLDLAYTAGVSEIMVSGHITDMDEQTRTFTMGSLVVEYDPLFQTDLNRLTDGVVKVSGIIRPDNGHLILTGLSNALGLSDVEGGRQVILEGVVSSFQNKPLAVNHVPVKAPGNAEGEDEIQENVIEQGITPDSHVVLEGKMDRSGHIVAHSVQLLKSSAPVASRIKLIGSVDELLEHGIRMLGLDVQLRDQVLYVDHSQARLTTLGLIDLNPGDRIKVLSWRSGDINQAVLVERKHFDEAAPVEIKGLVSLNDDGALLVAGVMVNPVEEQTTIKDADGKFINAQQLDAYLAGSNPVLEVEGHWDGAAVTASLIRLDD